MQNELRNWRRSAIGVACGCLFAIPCLAQTDPYVIPQKGIVPTGFYELSKIEAIDSVSGNLTIHIPLSALPPGHAGFSTALDLYYNSAIWGTYVDSPAIQSDPTRYELVSSTFIDPNDTSGWRYGFQYSFTTDYLPYNTSGCGSSTNQSWLRYRVVFPDGSSHVLYIDGKTNDWKGYNPYAATTPNGCVGPSQGGTLNLYSADGTYVRMNWNADNGQWTLFFPDGRRVYGTGAIVTAPSQNSAGFTANASDLYDRNNNHIQISPQYDSNNKMIGYVLQDDVLPTPRTIKLEFNSGQDVITQTAYKSQTLYWYINWGSQTLTSDHTYDPGDGTATHPVNNGGGVQSIVLPNSLQYQFCYDGMTPQPSWCVGKAITDPTQWGVLSDIFLPTGAYVHYAWNGPSAGTWGNWSFPIGVKTVKWTDPADASLRTEATNYTFTNTYSQFTNPDGSHTKHWFYDISDQNVQDWFTGLVYRVDKTDSAADEDRLEQIWLQNMPYGPVDQSQPRHTPGNPYVQTQINSEGVGGTPTIASAKVLGYDRNGNQTQVAEYDWMGYANVAHNGSVPTGFSNGTLIRTTSTSYINGATLANPSGDTVDDAQGYWKSLSPQILNLPYQLSVSGSPGSTTQFAYDSHSPGQSYALTKGNPTTRNEWNSVTSTYLSTVYTYDSVGNVLSTTNPRLFTTGLDLSPFLTQPVKTQNPFKGELSHGVVEKDVHQRVQAGRGEAAGARSFPGRGGAGVGGERQRAAPLAA